MEHYLQQLISQGERPEVRNAKVYILEGQLSAEDVETVLKGWDVLGLSDTATTLTLAGTGAADANTFAEPDRLVPVNGTLPVAETFSVTLPPWSLTVIRVPALTESEAIIP